MGEKTSIYQSAPRELSQENTAEKIIISFIQQFGDAHFALACHAAFPLALTPDLLYRIWANFTPQTPWTAVADLLLSPLCRAVGYELYEMDLAVRSMLLEELKADDRLGPARFDELAEFLAMYVARELHSDDPEVRMLAQGRQRWTALAYTQPGETARQLAATLVDLLEEKGPELIRLASMVEVLAEPLFEFTHLLVYASSIQNWVRGQIAEASARIKRVYSGAPYLTVNEVILPIPREIVLQLGEQSPTLPPVLDAENLFREALTLLVETEKLADDNWLVQRLDCAENAIDIHIILGQENRAITKIAELERLISKEYFLENHGNFSDILEPTEEFWNILGRLELHRARLLVSRILNQLPHLPKSITKPSKLKLSSAKEKERDSFLRAINHYARAFAYFITFSTNAAAKESIFFEIQELLQAQNMITLPQIRKQITNTSDLYDTIDFGPLLRTIDQIPNSTYDNKDALT